MNKKINIVDRKIFPPVTLPWGKVAAAVSGFQNGLLNGSYIY